MVNDYFVLSRLIVFGNKYGTNYDIIQIIHVLSCGSTKPSSVKRLRAISIDSSLLFAFISILPLGYIETSTPLYISNNMYSGSRDTNLVSFFPVYQYTDPDMPAPKIIEVTPVKTIGQDNSSAPPPEQPIPEYMIWITGIISVIVLFYIVRKLW